MDSKSYEGIHKNITSTTCYVGGSVAIVLLETTSNKNTLNFSNNAVTLVLSCCQKKALPPIEEQATLLNMFEDTKRCFFNCNRSDSLVTGGVNRLKKTAESSRERGDTIRTQIESGLQDGSLTSLQFHKVCVSSYTFKQHIQGAVKKKGEQ
ncbi:unnamed protein product [Ceutorhynchus assimilis]|uniref:Uncharacterized protein n=1 Tax=Ceutorhynchus assimilis TaxID=467358 RepID=A0A9N9MDB6_9CUCU|nr:unnamed protein product [Ceutorhynchus assimilis]